MRIPSTLLLVALSGTLLATPVAAAQVPDFVAAAPGGAEYPSDDGLILRQLVRVTLSADGRVETHVEESWKMLTAYLTRHDYFDPRVSWNDARQTLHIDQARTYMADGTVIDAKDNSRVPNTADVFQWAVPYAQMRQLTVAHVGVEHGATSTLAYTLADRTPAGEPFYGQIETQSFVPILDQWITIEVPEGTELKLAGVHGDVTAQVSSEGGKTIHTIHQTDVPRLNLSENGWDHTALQRVVYSTAADWEQVRTHLAGRVEVAAVSDHPVTLKTDEILDGSTQPREQVARLHRFVVDAVRTIDWPVADFDHQVRTAAQVLDSSVGHPLDKAVLLTGMLRGAGIDAHVALVSSDPAGADDVPCADAFDQVWVRVRLGDPEPELWLDPTAAHDAHNRWDLAGRPALILDPAATGITRRPTLDAEDNRAALRADVTLTVDGDSLAVAGTADVDLAYRYNPLAGFDRDGSRHEKVAGGIAGTFGGAGADQVTVAQQGSELVSFRTEFSGGSLPVPDSGLVQLAIPRVPGALTGSSVGSFRGARTLPVRLPRGAGMERVDLTVTLPEGFELAFVPDDLALANGAGSVRRSVAVEDGELKVTTLLVVEQDDLPAASYPDLRALLDALETDSASTVLLRRAD
jgi:transglutaminase-like putative cysteine protease